MPEPGSTKRAPSETPSTEQLNPNDKKYLEKLYKSAVYFDCKNIPFKGGDSNALFNELKKLQQIQPRSLNGSDLTQLYNSYIQQGLKNENPITGRVFLGELLRRLKPTSSAPGFVRFMNFMVQESRQLQPYFVENMLKLVNIIESLPEGKYKNERLKDLLVWSGLPPKHKKKGLIRPVDPIFGTKKDEEIGTGELPYGPLEGQAIIDGKAEIMDISKLDPFQIILYKKLAQGYNDFVEGLRKSNDLKQLFTINRPDIQILRRKIALAIESFEHWIVKTINMMPASKSDQLLPIYKQRIAALKFPSLPHIVHIIKGGIAGAPVRALASLYFRAVKEKNKTSPIKLRDKIEGTVKSKLNAAIPTIKLVSKYIGPFKDILARRKMFRAGENRTFLNRFWSLAFRRYKSASGNERLKFELIIMILDSIKDDNELVGIMSRVKPILVDLLQNSPDADKISMQYFKKHIRDLKPRELNDILNMLLPSHQVKPNETESQAYSDMKKLLLSKIKEINLEELKKKNYIIYVALTTSIHNILNLFASMANEKNYFKAKQKIQSFIDGFEAVKKLITPLPEGVSRLILKGKKDYFDIIMNQPKLAVFFLKINSTSAIKKAIENFERINNLKQPPLVQELIQKAVFIKEDLLQRRALYLKKLISTDKTKRLKTLNVQLIGMISQVDTEIKNIDGMINELHFIWDTKALKSKEDKIKQTLYSTRYLNISHAVRKNLDMRVLSEAKMQKTDYNNLFFVSGIIANYINIELKKLCKNKNCTFAFSRLAPIVKQIILSFGKEEQIKLNAAKDSAYNYLNNNYDYFTKELATRINAALKQTTFSAQSDVNSGNIYFGANVDRYIGNVLKKFVLPKAKRAAPQAVASR